MNQARPPRPPARSGGASPAAQVVLVVVALVVGFLILRSFGDDDGGNASPDTDDTSAVTDTTEPSETTTTPATTQAPLNLATVVVANGAGVGGLAGKTTEYLTAQGVTTITATDANTRYESSAVYYQPGLESQAQQVATILNIAAVQAFPTQLPLSDPAALGTANVLVLLGQDFATNPIATGEVATSAPA